MTEREGNIRLKMSKTVEKIELYRETEREGVSQTEVREYRERGTERERERERERGQRERERERESGRHIER